MKLYSDMIANTHDLISARERLEWSNFWYDDTNKDVEHRILLVGDSTARMVRSTLANITGCSVDLLGTSSGLHDIFLAKQMDIFFVSNKYKYDAIFVQLGHHSRIGETGLTYNELDYECFESDYSVLVDYLSQFSDKVVLLSIFFSVIPYKYHLKFKPFMLIEKSLRRYRKEIYDESINEVKVKKNKIIENIAKNKGIDFFDINQYMINLAKSPKTICLHTDHVHYEDKAKEIIAKEYCRFLSL